MVGNKQGGTVDFTSLTALAAVVYLCAEAQELDGKGGELYKSAKKSVHQSASFSASRVSIASPTTLTGAIGNSMPRIM